MNPEWTVLLSRLADELTENGKLSSPRWQAAFRATPRHVFVPEYLEQDPTGAWRRIVVNDADVLSTVYSNVGLVTDVDADGRAISSSSMPGLMTRMLELLDIGDGDRVLEIGTGTGYNTALLCAGSGDRQVASVDVDYTDAARRRLASLGHRPVLRTGDGVEGIPGLAPFQRIIATVAAPCVPLAWLDQLADGGLVLVDVKVGAAGNLVLLRKRGGVAEGRFDAGQAWFMGMRHPGRAAPPTTGPAAGPPTRRTTTVPAVVWARPVPWFLACLMIEAPVDVGYRLDDEHRPVAARLTSDDGSWAEVDTADDRPREVAQAGPTALWDAVEHATELWERAGQPTWDRLGLTVTADEQRVWLDSPDGPVLGRLPT